MKYFSDERLSVAIALASALCLGTFVGMSQSASAASLTAFQACPKDGLPERIADKAQCATLTVPENRAVRNGRKLILPVLKIPAAGKNPGAPVFVLNGGPGGANLGGIIPMAKVEEARDVYYIGYRGAEGSTVLLCPEINAHIDAPAILSDANLQKLAEASGACAARLQKSGVDLSHYTMLDVIDDLEDVRSALGQDKVNLVSNSYGTRVAQYYARRHPGSVFRSVMLGANPPGHFVFSAYVHGKVLDRLAHLCAADAACAAQTIDLKRTILNALHAGRKTGNTRIDDGKSQLGLFYALYSRDITRLFVAAAIASEKGDLNGLEQVGKMATAGTKGTIWGDLLSKGILDAYRYPALEGSFPATVDSMGSPLDRLFQAVGKNWPRMGEPEEYRRATLDRTQTLVINGDIDVATPLIFIEAELMPYLPNGKLLVLKDYGHSDESRQGSALDQIVATYFETGRADASLLKEDPYVF